MGLKINYSGSFPGERKNVFQKFNKVFAKFPTAANRTTLALLLGSKLQKIHYLFVEKFTT